MSQTAQNAASTLLSNTVLQWCLWRLSASISPLPLWGLNPPTAFKIFKYVITFANVNSDLPKCVITVLFKDIINDTHIINVFLTIVM